MTDASTITVTDSQNSEMERRLAGDVLTERPWAVESPGQIEPEGGQMKAFLVFSEAEPLLIMSSRAAADDGRLIGGLTDRGFDKFIAYEVPLNTLRERYGVPFEVIEQDVRNGKEIRVLDYKGSHVLENVAFADLGPCIRHESTDHS